MSRRKITDWERMNCDPITTCDCNQFVSSDKSKDCICYRTKIPIFRWEARCWKCGQITPHVTYNFGCGSSRMIGSLPILDMKLMELYPFVRKVFSRTMQEETIANTCVHCGSLQGNFYMMEELINMIGQPVCIDKWI